MRSNDLALAGVFGASVVGLASAACTKFPDAVVSDAGEPDAESASGIGRCGFEFASDDACGECIESECCTFAERCRNSEMCEMQASCIAECSRRPDEGFCLANCLPGETSFESDPETVQMLACVTDSCGDRCSSCGAATIGVGEQCEACLIGTPDACGELARCSNESGCVGELLCATVCRHPACVLDCGDEPELISRLLEVVTLIDVNCGSACQLGRDWACTDGYSWPGSARGETNSVLFPNSLN